MYYEIQKEGIIDYVELQKKKKRSLLSTQLKHRVVINTFPTPFISLPDCTSGQALVIHFPEFHVNQFLCVFLYFYCLCIYP